MGEVIIRYISLPCRIKGFVREDCDGNYNIYINANQSFETQQKTLEHELKHIDTDDFHNDFDGSM